MRKILFSVSLVSLLSSCATQKELVQAPLMQSCPAASGQQIPELLWTHSEFSNPESVVYDKKTKHLYVSNVAGAPTDKDGKGWISKLTSRGKLLKGRWVEGFDAPKGMRVGDGMLWVSDIDKVLGVQTRTGKKSVNVAVPGAQFLNDIAVSNQGDEVFVTDMITNKVHSLRNSSELSVVAEGRSLESPNGIATDGDKLLIASWGNDIQADFSTPRPGRVLSLDPKTGTVTPWTEASMGNLDGLEMDGPDAVIVSDWVAGKVYHLKRNGECRTILEGLKGSADIGYIAETRTLIVPQMSADSVSAYKLSKF